jgi:hypothetical protein
VFMPNRRENRKPIAQIPMKKVEIKNMLELELFNRPVDLRDDLLWDEQLDNPQFKEDLFFFRPSMPHIVDIVPTYEEEGEEATLEEVCRSWWSEVKGFIVSPANKIYRWVRYTSKNRYELCFQLISKLFFIWLIHAALSSQRWQDPSVYVPRETMEGDSHSYDRHLKQNSRVLPSGGPGQPNQAMMTPELQKVLQGFRESSRSKSRN